MPSAYPSFFSSTAWPIQGLSQTRSRCITPGLLNPAIVPAPPAPIALPTAPTHPPTDGRGCSTDHRSPGPGRRGAAARGLRRASGTGAEPPHFTCRSPSGKVEPSSRPFTPGGPRGADPGAPRTAPSAPQGPGCHAAPAAATSLGKRMDANPKQDRRLTNPLIRPCFFPLTHWISLFFCIMGALVPSAGQRSPSGASSPQLLFYAENQNKITSTYAIFHQPPPS